MPSLYELSFSNGIMLMKIICEQLAPHFGLLPSEDPHGFDIDCVSMVQEFSIDDPHGFDFNYVSVSQEFPNGSSLVLGACCNEGRKTHSVQAQPIGIRSQNIQSAASPALAFAF
jgi:hypothetical protein